MQPTLTQLLAKYPNDVKLVYKHMPLDQLHPQARRAAEASWCAQQQGKFWQYHDLLYAGGPDGSDRDAVGAGRPGRARPGGLSAVHGVGQGGRGGAAAGG